MWARRGLILLGAIIIVPTLLLGAFFSGLVWEILPLEQLGVQQTTQQAHTSSSPSESLAPRHYVSLKRSMKPLLSDQDVVLYQRIAQMQTEKRWRKADELLNKLDNRLLRGHFLAERYLGPGYVSSSRELRRWLRSYPDHPQAAQIEKLALQKNAIQEPNRHRVVRRISYNGDSHSNLRFRNSKWRQGLKSFQKADYASAYDHFASLSDNADMYGWKGWDQSALHFWAHRAATAMGQKQLSRRHLLEAASASRSFYGILAQLQLNKELKLVRTPVPLTGEQVDALYTIPAVRRMVALAEVGKEELIESEIHHLFPSLSHKRKTQLLSLIMPLSLPATQIRMGLALEIRGPQSLDYAVYPMPDWQPEDGYLIDRALLMAIARQESGFNPTARSYAGAKGLMQIMPATARYMVETQSVWHGLNRRNYDLSDPIQSITLGQRYLHYLMQKDYIGENLVYLTMAYNAGPGNLQKWQRKLESVHDPLLFIERIPSLETRNYVQNVLRNYWIYRALVESGDSASDSTKALLAGQWPKYPNAPQQIAQVME